MSTSTKRLLVIIGIAAVFCIISVGAAIAGIAMLANRVQQGIATDPATIHKMANDFIHYDVPAGYTEEMGMDFIVYKMILIGASDRVTNKPMIFLAHFQAQNLTPEQMSQQMQQSMAQQSGTNGLNLKVVETRTITINGQQTTLTVSEGTDDNGIGMRQWVTAFPGKTGMVLLMIQGRIDEWDDATMNTFLASITT